MSRVFKRDRSFWIDFKDAQGVRRRKKIGPSKRIAREVLDGLLGNVARRQYLGVIADSAVGFNVFAEVWWARVKPALKPSTQRRWSGIVDNHLKPAFPGALRAISKGQVEAYLSKRREAGASPGTCNRETTVLKRMLRHAVEWEYLAVNPLAGLKPLREPAGRTRFANVEEIDRLLVACSQAPLLKAFVVLALNTGMRRNEVLTLTRRSINWNNRFVTLTVTKNGETRIVFLNDRAYDALKTLPLPLADDAPLFPFTANEVSKAFARAVKRASLADLRLHDLRHTFASHQAMNGVQGRGLQMLMGHKDPRMTVRYSHLSDDYLRAAVNRVNLGSEAPKDGTYLAPAKALDGKA
ncbi:MAG: tyrosine-type recombinase/integrase [Candidatus Binataceae bacterium]